ncbi:MAG: hypothetical protein HUU01_04195 [Saprospiraceae bacterium]|nr:hypothetical protein [Saprospiraceae bacterium]
MTTNSFCPLLLIGHPRRIFFVFFFAVFSTGLFAQSDKAFQVEMGVEQYLDFSGLKAAASGFFIEGRYQHRQVDFGIKIGSPLWTYGTDDNLRYYTDESVMLNRPFFGELPAYFEGSFHYKPNFRHAKPFFGIGGRYILREDHQEEFITASQHIYHKEESPSYFVPVINVGYYYKNLKFQLNYIFGKNVRSKVNNYQVVHYANNLNAGISYIFGVGSRTSKPSYEMSFSQKERVFRPLAFRLEVTLGHQVAFGKYGIGSSISSSVEAKARVKNNFRVGFQIAGSFALGLDRKSEEIYIHSGNKIFLRDLNAGSQLVSYVLFGEQVLKSTVSKDILVVGAGLGLYRIEESYQNSYKDNGVTIELPPQLKQASLPGLHLRVGQRFGAFSHSAFVNLIPGQVPVTLGVQLGLGLNIFGKQQAEVK